jgi:hypothetical protein
MVPVWEDFVTMHDQAAVRQEIQETLETYHDWSW